MPWPATRGTKSQSVAPDGGTGQEAPEGGRAAGRAAARLGTSQIKGQTPADSRCFCRVCALLELVKSFSPFVCAGCFDRHLPFVEFLAWTCSARTVLDASSHSGWSETNKGKGTVTVMNRICVDVKQYQIFAAETGQAKAVVSYVDGQATSDQAKNDAGIPLWSTSLILAGELAAETVKVKFASWEPPTFESLKPVAVEGLCATVVKERVYFAASSVTVPAASAPSKGQA